MDAFSKLPNEVVVMIFEKLEMGDVVNRCGLVSKRFRFLAHQVRFQELVILNGSANFDNFWHPNFEPINLRKTVCHDVEFLTSSSFKSSFINLIKLKIDLATKSDFDIGILEEFSRLQHLELSRVTLKEDRTIRLPSARLIKISRINLKDEESASKLVVNAAQLRIFCCDHLALYELADSRAIERIEIALGSERLGEQPSLKMLKLFRCLKMDRKLLCRLPNLERLHLYDSFDDEVELEELRETIVNLLALKKALRMFGLKIYFNGVHLADVESANAYFDQDFNQEELVLLQHNYEQLEPTLPWIRDIFYWNLFAIFNDLPNDFYAKFNNIQFVQHVGDTETQERFVAFLEHCPNLSEIKLIYPNFDRAFYEEQLPALTPLISRFSLREKRELQIDYDFLRNFPLLIDFATNQNLNMDYALNSLAKFGKLRRFAFSSGRNNVMIEKSNENRYNLRHDPRGDVNFVQACKRDIGFDSLREACLSLDQERKCDYRPRKLKAKPGRKRRS